MLIKNLRNFAGEKWLTMRIQHQIIVKSYISDNYLTIFRNCCRFSLTFDFD